jgi:hypothetical protein
MSVAELPRGADVGTPLDQLRRYAQRQIEGQRQPVQLERSLLVFSGQTAREHRQ